MSDWKKYKLGDIVTLKRGYDLPQQSRINGKYPIYSSAGLSGFHIKAMVKGPGVITGRYGTLGEVFYSENDYWPHNTTLYVKDFKDNFPRFIYYFLQTLGLNNQNDKTSVPGLNRNHLHEMDVCIPDDPYTQTRIASILSSLDDKIELNRRMNQTLEQMAKALFNHYFVDNIDPDNLPEGWRWGRLHDEFDITMGQSPEGTSYNEIGIGIPFFQGRTDFNFRFPSFRVYTTSPKRFAKPNDILLSVRAPVGNLNIALADCCIGRGLAALRNKKNLSSYGYYKMKSLTVIFEPYNGEGTVFGSINKDELAKVSIIIPSGESLKTFDEIVSPMDLKIREMHIETNNLIKIRDTLLPKLMSGEIDVDKK